MDELEQRLLVKVAHHELVLGGKAPHPGTRTCTLCGKKLSTWNDDPYCCACWEDRQEQCEEIDNALERLKTRSRDLMLISRIQEPLDFVRDTGISFEDLVWHPLGIRVRLRVIGWVRAHTVPEPDAEDEEGKGHVACLMGTLHLPKVC
jgi:hypothetical protein